MKIDLSVLDKKILTVLKAVGAQAEQLGIHAYLVGGVVRDVLLKRSSLDLDIVVEGHAIELAKAIAFSHKARLTVYEQFGTATVEFADGIVMDFATARSEHYPSPGSLPVVKPGSIKEDLFRRDFTINTMAVVLNPQRLGELQDFYGGYEDLKNKKVRVLHEKSFVDDPTRILRAVRFESRLSFGLEGKTLALLKAALKNQTPTTVKPPRYFAEFRKIFSEANPVAPLKRLFALKGLDFVKTNLRPDWKILSQLTKTSQKLKKDKFYAVKDWSGVFLLAFFKFSNAEQAQYFAKHFHLTKEELLSLLGLGQIRQILKELQASKLRPSEIYDLLDPVDLQIIYFIRATTSVNMVARRVDDFLKKSRMVSLAITGEDLKVLGIKPGREMGALLHTLLLSKIDGKIKNHQDEITLAKHLGFKY